MYNLDEVMIMGFLFFLGYAGLLVFFFSLSTLENPFSLVAVGTLSVFLPAMYFFLTHSKYDTKGMTLDEKKELKDELENRAARIEQEINHMKREERA